jgi:hypothetical protein
MMAALDGYWLISAGINTLYISHQYCGAASSFLCGCGSGGKILIQQWLTLQLLHYYSKPKFLKWIKFNIKIEVFAVWFYVMPIGVNMNRKCYKGKNNVEMVLWGLKEGPLPVLKFFWLALFWFHLIKKVLF